MKIIPCGAAATVYAPESYFTGKVLQTPIVEAEAPARLRALSVAFEPGARTAWHTHPLGQTLYVVSGAGRAQVWGEPIRWCIETFGADRCMFESNFPVDKVSCTYADLWAAFDLIAAGASETERADLFAGTATRAYRL